MVKWAHGPQKRSFVSRVLEMVTSHNFKKSYASLLRVWQNTGSHSWSPHPLWKWLIQVCHIYACYEDAGNALDFASFWLTFVLPFPCKASKFAFLFCQVISIHSDTLHTFSICLKYAKRIGLQFGYRDVLLSHSRWCFVDKTVGLRHWIGLACCTVFEILENGGLPPLSKQARDIITRFYLHHKISQLSLLLLWRAALRKAKFPPSFTEV